MVENKYERDCLRPALLKCYNAFECLRKLTVENSFYDNISNLDNFLIEYRSITFAIQKSLKSNNDPIYLKYRDLYLKSESSKWLLENRNIVEHEHPFDLGKRLTINVYTQISAEEIYKKEFDIENDQPYNSILEELKGVFLSFKKWEIYFSCTFQFIDNNKKYEIYPFIKDGITSIKDFFKAIYDDIKPEDNVTEDLLQKVLTYKFDRIPKDMLFIQDYVYNVKENHFERGYIQNLVVKDNKVPLAKYMKNFKGSNFMETFMILHIEIYKIQKHEMMPTFIVVYKDNTLKTKSYGFSIKTTMYRIVNNIAEEIIKEKVNAVYIVCENYYYKDNLDEFNKLTYQERINKMNPITNLAFYRIKEDASVISYFFDSSKIDDQDYILSTLKKGDYKDLYLPFLTPIIKAFHYKNDLD